MKVLLNSGNYGFVNVDARRCRDDLKAPKNGALACDYWLGGKFCHMFCRSRYDVPVGQIDGNDMFVCGQSGKWMPSSSVPNCASMHFDTSHFRNFAFQRIAKIDNGKLNLLINACTIK